MRQRSQITDGKEPTCSVWRFKSNIFNRLRAWSSISATDLLHSTRELYPKDKTLTGTCFGKKSRNQSSDPLEAVQLANGSPFSP
jgi:hypothetical protein